MKSCVRILLLLATVISMEIQRIEGMNSFKRTTSYLFKPKNNRKMENPEVSQESESKKVSNIFLSLKDISKDTSLTNYAAYAAPNGENCERYKLNGGQAVTEFDQCSSDISVCKGERIKLYWFELVGPYVTSEVKCVMNCILEKWGLVDSKGNAKKREIENLIEKLRTDDAFFPQPFQGLRNVEFVGIIKEIVGDCLKNLQTYINVDQCIATYGLTECIFNHGKFISFRKMIIDWRRENNIIYPKQP